MRYLKNKIALAKNLRDEQAQKTTSSKLLDSSLISQAPQIQHNTSPVPISHKPKLATQTTHRTKTTADDRLTPESYRATKNIVKNFGKAICKFAISSVALPYLASFVERERVGMKKFTAYVDSIRPKIDGLHHFRAILLSDDGESEEMRSFKKIFRDISEVFIKYFSVNWVFHSKILHKEAHLKFRFKMLRRIQDPEMFTYLKSSKKGSTGQRMNTK